MDSIEKAIRSAFAKGDPGDRAFREKVYRSAFGALDRTLKANPNMTEAIAARRRETLLAAITAIETEFVPARAAAPANPAAPPTVSPEPARRAPQPASPAPERREPAFAPTLDGERRQASHSEETAKAGRGAASAREGRRARPRRRFPFLGLLVLLLLLAGAAAGLWWLVTSGTGERLLEQRPPQSGDSARPPMSGGGEALEGWIDIFTPADPTTVAAPGDSRAEIMEEDGERFIRIRAGASGSPVLFDVGQGVLEQVAGRRAVFTITARAQEEQETQISVDCTLGELGDCGRKRYGVGATREEFLFEIDLPAQRPGAGGTIAVNPDIEGGGKAVDIYAIRVLPTQ